MGAKSQVGGAPLFGNPANADRYDPGTRDKRNRPWDVREELLMFPVLAACQSQTADDEARKWLCHTYGRLPQRAGKRRDEAVRAGYRSIISNRLVTRYFTGGAVNWGLMQKVGNALFRGARTGEPFTWADYRVFHLGRLEKAKQGPVVPLASLLRLLDRGASDARRVETLAAAPPDLGTVASEQGHGRPARAANAPYLDSAARWFLECPLTDVSQLSIYWRSLWAVAGT